MVGCYLFLLNALQAKDIDLGFPWPLQHGVGEKLSIGGKDKTLN